MKISIIHQRVRLEMEAKKNASYTQVKFIFKNIERVCKFFTPAQVVWADSNKVGCALITCLTMKHYIPKYLTAYKNKAFISRAMNL